MTHHTHTRPLEILRLDSSSRYADSVSRHLTDYMIARLLQEYPAANVTTRNLAEGLPMPTEAFVDGSLYAMQDPTPAMQAAVQLSDEMVAELLAADIVVLGLPMYNWTIPSTFKAYVDQISRVGTTFAYVDGVSHGLLRARNVYVVYTSGGTAIGSDNDFATPYVTYLWQKLAFPMCTSLMAPKFCLVPNRPSAKPKPRSTSWRCQYWLDFLQKITTITT